MTLPVSGQLSLLDISKELETSSNDISLTVMSNNTCKTSPNGISEFYGYSKPKISINPTSITCDYNGKCTPELITINCPITYIKTKSDEISLIATGEANKFTITVTPNLTPNTKNLFVKAETQSGCASSDVSTILNFVQDAMPATLTFEPSIYKINYQDPLNKVVKAISGAGIRWTHKTLPDHITKIEPSIFTGTTDLTITSNRNISPTDITGNIEFYIVDSPQITSSLPYILANAGPIPNIIVTPPATFSGSITEYRQCLVDSNYDWNATINKGSFETVFQMGTTSWVSGKMDVEVTCFVNDDTPNSGSITFIQENTGYYTPATITVPINQYAAASVFNVLNVPQTTVYNSTFNEISISANTIWSATIDDAWAGTITPSSGSGVHIEPKVLVTFTNTQTNPLATTRKTNISFNKYNGISKYELIQKGAPLSVDISSQQLSYKGISNTAQNITITTNSPWKITGVKDTAYLTLNNININQMMSPGTYTFSANLSDNLSGIERENIIYVSFIGDITKNYNITLSQAKTPTLTFNPTELTHDPSKGEQGFVAFTSSDPSLIWYLENQLTNDQGYVTTTEIKTVPGSAYNNVYASLANNFTPYEITHTIRYYLKENKSIYKDLRLIRPPKPYFSLSDENINFSSYERFTINNFYVYTGAKWTCIRKPDWITLSTMSGIGDTNIIITGTENNTSDTRVGNIAFLNADESVGLSLTVSQVAKLFDVYPRQLSFPYISASKTVEISADPNLEWDVYVNTTHVWVVPEYNHNKGSATFTITCEQNDETSPRTSDVSFIVKNYKQIDVHIDQEYCLP